jgi:PAS domain S-box-containing protein
LDELEALTRRIERERQGRHEAEQLLEQKSRALYAAAQESNRLALELRQTVSFQTQQLLDAQRVAQIGTFIWAIDSELITWSDGVYAILGIDPDVESLSFDRYLESVLAEDRTDLRALIERNVEAGLVPGVEVETTHRIRRPGGEERWIKGLGKVVESKSGSRFLSAAIQDITEITKADLEVERSQRLLKERLGELEKAQKILEEARSEAETANHTKSRFIAMISHEIRTPINGLLGTLSLLADSKLDDTQRELLEIAETSGETLRLLLNDVIDFSRLETGDIQLEPTEFSVRTMGRRLIEFWEPQARSRGNRLSVKIDPEIPRHFRGDAARIGQVLNNLVSNAVKFTEDGEVSINLKVDDQFSTEPSRCCLRVDVVDSGIGIARENLPNLFKEFSQVARAEAPGDRFYDLAGDAHGAGLGLAICRSLVERMAGKISVTSALGEGSIFSVRLPLEIASDTIDAPPSESDFEPLRVEDGRSPRALIAEDVQANQLVARMLLEKFGCKVDIASDGTEAVYAVQRNSYDFVLMDISMPRMDGVDATKKIRGLPDPKTSTMPIIGLTAFAFTDEWSRFYEAGMDGVISKPIQRNQLYEAIKSALVAGTPADTGSKDQTDNSHVNFEALDALIKGFSKEQVDQVFNQVSQDLDGSRHSAIAYARDGDLASLGRSCHAIKGLAASFGGEALADLARRIEEFVVVDDGERAVATTLDQLGPATDAVLTALAAYTGFSGVESNHG